MAQFLTMTLAAVAVTTTMIQVGLLVRLAVPAVRNRAGGPARS